jgi:hypothetical protein
MKQITLFAMLFISSFCYSQQAKNFSFTEHPSAYLDSNIYRNIDSVKNFILSDNNNRLVSYKDGVLIVRSEVNGFVSTIVLKSNRITGIVYSYDKILHSSEYIDDVVIFYNNFVGNITDGSWYKPYDMNSDPSIGDIYSKWLFTNGMLIVKINLKGEFVIHSERIYDNDMVDLVNSLRTR